jgi:hypothetical protein
MGATKVWLGNESWPSNRSCRQFALDVFRLAGAKTDKQKALAFYDGLTRCMMRGPNLLTPDGACGYSRNYDALPLLTSWGHGECTFWGWVATECLCAAGLKARRVVVHNQGHTYYEVWYKGDDGVEQWHAFDPFGGWYFLNEHDEVASCEELARNPQLAQNPRPGHPVPLGHHPDRANLAHRHRTEDQIFIDQPIRNETLHWNLHKGMEVTMNFIPAVLNKALFPVCARAGEPPVAVETGTHCDMAELSRLGHRQLAAHLPYWKNYMLPTDDAGGLNERRPVRWHGEGALRWKPLLQGADVTCETHNAKFENGALKPAGQHQFTEVWYHFQLPFLASYISIDYDVVGAGGDFFGLCLSADNRRTWWSIVSRNNPHYGMAGNGQAQWRAGKSSIQGLREFWLRIDMVSHSAQPALAMLGCDVTVGFQHNMFVQPMLVPGANPLWLEAGNVDANSRVEAEWVYQVRGEERRARLQQGTAGRAGQVVAVDAASPTEILMTGVKLRCV